MAIFSCIFFINYMYRIENDEIYLRDMANLAKIIVAFQTET